MVYLSVTFKRYFPCFCEGHIPFPPRHARLLHHPAGIHNNPIKRKQHNFGVGLGTQLSTRPGMFLFIVGSFVCTRYSVTNMKRSSERQQEDNIAVTTIACEKLWSPGEHC